MWAGHPAREELLLRVVDMASALKNANWKSLALCMLSLIEEERGNDAEGLVYVEAALASAREYGNIHTIATLEAQNAALLARLGNEAQARHRLEAQLEKGRQTQKWAILLPTLDGLGELAFARRAWDEARGYYEELLGLAQQFHRGRFPICGGVSPTSPVKRRTTKPPGIIWNRDWR